LNPFAAWFVTAVCCFQVVEPRSAMALQSSWHFDVIKACRTDRLAGSRNSRDRQAPNPAIALFDASRTN
jgi:hypothetical protein